MKTFAELLGFRSAPDAAGRSIAIGKYPLDPPLPVPDLRRKILRRLTARFAKIRAAPTNSEHAIL